MLWPQHLKVLCENYIELRMTSMEYREKSLPAAIQNVFEEGPALSTITVTISEERGTHTLSIVDPEDKTYLEKYKWKLSRTGYAIYEMGSRHVSVHELLTGSREVTHKNCNPLDNRKHNLETKKALSPLELRWANDEAPEPTFRSTDSELNEFSGFCHVLYRATNRRYRGHVANGIPHGYGHLLEDEKQVMSCGMWEKGKLKEGMVVEYKALPRTRSKLWEGCPLREVSAVYPVIGGLRQRSE